jgi:hypothetical protein
MREREVEEKGKEGRRAARRGRGRERVFRVVSWDGRAKNEKAKLNFGTPHFDCCDRFRREGCIRC